MDDDDQTIVNLTVQKATFGMGCFWRPDCVFGCIPGVTHVKVGYCGGTGKNPTFKKIGDFLEAVEVEFDSLKTSYKELLHIFWENHDSTHFEKAQHRSAIFYNSPEQKTIAEASLSKHKKINTITQLLPATEFFNAEDYHQKHALQQHPEIMTALNIPQNHLHRSHIATRLNGYVAGCGKMEAFDLEVEDFGLSEEVEQLVRELIEKNSYSVSPVICPEKEL